MTARIVVLELARLEAAHLTDLVEQFTQLLDDSALERATDDPGIARLVPDAYRDDREAAGDFRRLTQDDLLDRRIADAGMVLTSLRDGGERLSPGELSPASGLEAMTVRLEPAQSAAWLRTLAALRLVLASRLGIEADDDHDSGDPRFGVYDWLGYRLDGLVQALND